MGRALAFAAVALIGFTSALHLQVDFSDEAWKERPVSKVAGMLKDMKEQLEEEAANDGALYDKLVCWCETNEKLKTQAIEIAKSQIADLTASIEEFTAKDGQLTLDIEATRNQIAKDTKALEEAGEIRAKENSEFASDEKDTTASIESLGGAVTALGKAHGGALLQREALVQVTKVLRRSHAAVKAAVAPHQRHLITELLQRPDGMVSLLQQPVAASSYAPASGEIFGMLKQMKESFEGNLESSRASEATAAKAFAQLKSAKQEELDAAAKKAFNDEVDLGKTKESNAAAKGDLKNTEAALESDTNFLADLRSKCTTMDEDWAARSKMRQEEIAAVADTIAMLTSDDAADQFSKTLGLLQVRAESHKSASTRKQALKFLKEAGTRLNSRRITYLAERMQFDPFAKLREGIDEMSTSLGKEKEDEIVHKDDCISDFSENDKETTSKKNTKSDLETEINSLNSEEDVLRDEEKKAKAAIFDAQLQMKKAGEDREEENKVFQETVADQRATQEILKKAVERLAQFYNKFALVQTKKQDPVPGAAVEAMPAGFKPYKKGQGGGAMALIEGIIADSKDTEKDAIQAEQDSQKAYESFIKDTNDSVKALMNQLSSDEEHLAKDEIKESADEGDKRQTIEDILTLNGVEEALHQSCDFTLDNFAERQSKRDDEIEALKQSKAIFSGMQ
jgi:hypothetical protein